MVNAYKERLVDWKNDFGAEKILEIGDDTVPVSDVIDQVFESDSIPYGAVPENADLTWTFRQKYDFIDDYFEKHASEVLKGDFTLPQTLTHSGQTAGTHFITQRATRQASPCSQTSLL